MRHNINKTISHKLKAGIAITAGLLISACAQTAEDPKIVADMFWHNMQTGNTLEAEKLVSSNSRTTFMEQKDELISIDQLQTGPATTIVTTTITSIDPTTKRSRTHTVDTVLVLQQGQWKIDANRTRLPPSPSAQQAEMQKLADELSESMHENIESLDETMTRGMHMLNEALRDGSKEMGTSLLEMMNELNRSMKESIEKMKQQRQQKQQQPPPADPDTGEGKI